MNTVSVEYNRNAGLGNKLFPWCRALIVSYEYCLPFKYQLWFSPKGAGIIRGGIDYSTIIGKQLLLGNFKTHVNEIGPLRSVLSSINQDVFLVGNLVERDSIVQAIENSENIDIKFQWSASHNFTDLIPYRCFILEQIISVAKLSRLKYFNKYQNKKFIVFNIRCGNDFIESHSQQIGYKKTSLSFFLLQFHEIRNRLGDVEILIISDGGKKQLSSLLLDSNIKIFKSQFAIEDLLVMSLACELYGSGNSTFSAWASFLGNMPTFTAQETSFSHFHLPNTHDL